MLNGTSSYASGGSTGFMTFTKPVELPTGEAPVASSTSIPTFVLPGEASSSAASEAVATPTGGYGYGKRFLDFFY